MSVRCGACLRDCPPGASYCGRRDAQGRPIAPHTYCALAADSLFEKPIRYLAPDFRVLSVGGWGCNLRCLGCQNPRLSWTTSGEGLAVRELEPRVLLRAARDLDCRGVCFTFNEPAVLLEWVAEAAREVKSAGLATVLVTNSTLTCSAVEEYGPLFDAVAADIKSLDQQFYDDYCGTQGLADVPGKILACILAFRRAGCHLEVRTNLIPGANDQEPTARSIARWIRENLGPNTAWHVTRFFPAHKLSRLLPTPSETILRAERIGRESGLVNVSAVLNKGCDCARDTDFVAADAPLPVAEDHECCCQGPKGTG